MIINGGPILSNLLLTETNKGRSIMSKLSSAFKRKTVHQPYGGSTLQRIQSMHRPTIDEDLGYGVCEVCVEKDGCVEKDWRHVWNNVKWPCATFRAAAGLATFESEDEVSYAYVEYPTFYEVENGLCCARCYRENLKPKGNEWKCPMCLEIEKDERLGL